MDVSGIEALSRNRLSSAAIIAALYALFAGLWIAASDWLLAFAIQDTALRARIGSIKGFVFVAVTTGLLYLLLRGWREAVAAQTADPDSATAAPKQSHLLLTFAVLIVVAPVLSYGIAHIHAPQLEREAYANLMAISMLKAGQIENWLNERYTDAEILRTSPGFVRQVEDYLRGNRVQAQIAARFETLRRAYGYSDILLLDASGQPLIGTLTQPLRSLSITLHQALTSGKVSYTDLYRDADGRIHLDWVVPIRLPQPVGGHASAMVLLRMDPGHFLFPLIQTWPTPSVSAETLLIRREGDRVQFLNELRHRKDTALAFSYPLDDPQLPAAEALRSGTARTLEGSDYRGIDVLVATRPVRGTSWQLLAKIDRSEVLRPLTVLVSWVNLVVFFAVVTITVTILMLWRQQQRAHRLALQARVADTLRESEERYRGLVANLPGAVYRSGVADDWPLLYVSEGIARLTGYRAGDFLGRTRRFHDIVHAADRLLLARTLEQLHSDRQPFSIEYRLLHRNGHIVWVLDSGQGYFGDDGELLWLDGFMSDISERKQAEAALAQQTALLRQIIDSIPDLIFYKDTKSQYLGCNKAFEMFAGRTEAEQIGRTDFDFFDADTAQLFRSMDRRMMELGQTRRNEECVVYPDGHHVLLETLKTPFYGPAGEVLGLVGISRDITEREQSEENLRLAATVFENTREGVLITDAEKRILRVNRSFCALTGYSEAEVLGMNPRLLQSGKHGPEFYAALWDSINRTGHWQGEIWNRRKNGEIYPELLSISAVTNESGAITHYVAVFADISQLKQTEQELEFLAHHDPLTRLPNRLLLLTRLQHSIETTRRERGRLALLMLDLDRFKDVNDSFGHPAGDELLQQVAERLNLRLRLGDTLTRLGGDEFTILLESLAHPEDAARVANEIIMTLHEPWHLSNGAEIHLGASVGISLFPDHGDTADRLLQQADAALYRAKVEGRNCFKYFSDDLTTAARNRIQLEGRLRHAIAERQLRIHFQPQVDIASGAIFGTEALVRWEDPEHGLIPPIRFIPVAEETGLIGEIGSWVLRETCRQGREWLDAGLPPLTLAVNLSPHQLRHGDIAGSVAQVLAETGFPPERLELELTESALMQREEEAAQLLQQFRALGIHLALDDFGTGYSSLAYLKRFPIDSLKIDRSFIQDIVHDQNDRGIISTIITMGHSLGLEVLAEGVETQEQLDFLRGQGCDSYQGYLTSKALPADVFAERFMTSIATRPV